MEEDWAQWHKLSHEAVDWTIDFMQRVESLPVSSDRQPGETRAMLPVAAPIEADSFESVWRELNEVIVPGLMNWQSPTFFGYFPANNSVPSILGELLSATLGVQGMLWSTSPACTELESLVLDWLVEVLGLPPAFRTDNSGGGVIQDSASSATLCAMIAARDRATGGESKVAGVRQPLTVYASTDAHSSIDKAAMICGIGNENVRHVPVSADRRMDVRQLRTQMEEDVANRHIPAMVVATVGTTATGAIDDVMAIAEVCREHQVWLHVDAAMMGSAAVSSNYRWLHQGIEHCDSYCFNPHKWLLVNFDCDCFYVRERSWLTRSLGINPEYLRNDASDSGAVIDYRDWQVPLGRRFRALKLWLVLKLYGVQQLQDMVEHHCELAETFATWVDRHPQLQLFGRQLNLITFTHRDGNKGSEDLLRKVNQDRRVFLTQARVGNQFILRVCIGQRATSKKHVGLLIEKFETVLGAGGS